MPVDASHICVICQSNCCTMCKMANYDGSNRESSRKFVVCNQHKWSHKQKLFVPSTAPSGSSSLSLSTSSNEMLEGDELKEAVEELRRRGHILTGYKDIVVSASKTNPSKSGRNLSSALIQFKRTKIN